MKNRSYGWWIGLFGGLAAAGAVIKSMVPAVKRRVMRAPNLLAKDHRMVSGLFWTLQQRANPSIRRSIFEQIRHQLDLHMQAEEEIFYPAVRSLRTANAESQVTEALQEHGQIKELLRELSAMDPIAQEFDDKVRELKGAVDHHVHEEENEMFELARRSMSNRELEELGERIHMRKRQLRERIAA